MNSAARQDCAFCDKFGNLETHSRAWYDAELLHSGEFVVVPALGALAAGHLMILTRSHYPNMGCLLEGDLMRLSSLLRRIRDVVSAAYGDVVAFEHGPALSAYGGGSCIDHAHLQVLPLSVSGDLLPRLSEKCDFRPMDDISVLSQIGLRNLPYVFFQDQRERMFICQPANVPSQYLRRVIAEELGRPDQWDYALFPNLDFIDATISRLRPLLMHLIREPI